MSKPFGLSTVIMLVRKICKAISKFSPYLEPHLEPAAYSALQNIKAACTLFMAAMPEPNNTPEIS